MTWFKVDDKLHDHRKARAAGTAAMGVWLLAGSWAADNLTDGFIPAAILPRWGRPRDANRLVEVGLWHADEQDGEKGWRFHEWAERQPTRAQKMAERAAKVQAGKIGGLASGRSRSQAGPKQPASGQVEPPSRPVPSKNNRLSAVADIESDDRFEEFWDTYDKKTSGRKPTEAKYRAALKKPGVTPDVLISAAHTYVAAKRAAGDHPKFTKNATTWLTGEHWADEADNQAETGDGGWFQPFRLPVAPPEVEGDPNAYEAWAEGRRAAWQAGERW